MNRTAIVLALLITLPATVAYTQELPLNTIRPEAMHAHMAFLADDLLEGRGPGTRGYELAAKYVAAQFEAMGLAPAGDQGTYFQKVVLRRTKAIDGLSTLTVSRSGREVTLPRGRDVAFLGDVNRPVVDSDAPVVFVGRAIHAPEFQYDDYQGIEVRGKIVAFLAGTAPATFPSEQQAYYSSNASKWAYAQAHGAVGVIVISTDSAVSSAERVVWTAPNQSAGSPTGILNAGAILTATAAAPLFEGAKKTFAEASASVQANQFASFDLPVRARLHVETRSEEITSENVVAIARGTDQRLKSEYVVMSAHLDHLGRGRAINGDDIYNGALDNAVSVAMMIEAARCLTHVRTRRSVLFLATTAEESGLLGADYFAHFPTVPRNDLVANINLDGTSALYPLRDVAGLGAEHSSLEAPFRKAAAALGLEVSPDPLPEEHFFRRADQYAFVLAGIPSIFVNEGLKSADPRFDGAAITKQWLETIYHSPKDDMNQPILYDWVVKQAQLNLLITYDVAQDSRRPAWKPGDFFAQPSRP